MRSNILKYTLSTLLTTVVVSGVVYAATTISGVATQTINSGDTMGVGWFQKVNDVVAQLGNIIDSSNNIKTTGTITSGGDLTSGGYLVLGGKKFQITPINLAEDVYGTGVLHYATYDTGATTGRWDQVTESCGGSKYLEYVCDSSESKTCTDVVYVDDTCIDGKTLGMTTESIFDRFGGFSLIPSANAMYPICYKTVDPSSCDGGRGGLGDPIPTTCSVTGAKYVVRTVTCKANYTVAVQ